MIAENWAKLQQLDDGARYCKVDLHVHTPASEDYKDKSVPYDDIVRHALDAELNMLAVTDHNTADGFDRLRAAAKGTSLVVLPGVEVTVEDIHLLAIFPEDATTHDVTYLLNNLKIRHEDMGKKKTISSLDLTITQVLQEIDKAGGIAIAAHTDSTKGLTEETRGEWRTAIVRHKALKVVEITKRDTKHFFDGTDPVYQRVLTCIRSSDAHHPDEIGARATWVKMGDCTFQSLRQIIFEPELRVRLEPPPQADYPRIVGLAVTGGVYEGQPFRFNPNLNCIIGGRGAGKSAVIDFLRFAVGLFPRSQDFHQDFCRRIIAILGKNHSAVAYVETPDGVFAIERRLVDYQLRQVPGAEPEVVMFEPEETVYRLVDGQPIESEQPAQDIFTVEVFGQGEVFELTRKADDQLSLIDEYAQVAQPKQQEAELVGQLRENSESIVSLQEKRDELAEQLEELPGITRELRELDQRLQHSVFKEHALWEEEKAFLEAAEEILAGEERQVSEWAAETRPPELPQVSESSPSKSLLDDAQKLMQDLFAALAKSRTAQHREVKQTIGKVSSLSGRWRKAYREHTSEYNRRIDDSGQRDLAALSKHRQQLRRARTKFETRVRPNHQAARKELAKLQRSRSDLLAQLAELREKMSDARQRTVEAMSSELEKGDVKIELGRRSNWGRFFELLNSTYEGGSRMKNREKHLRTICSSCTPSDLASLLAARDDGQLVAGFDLTEDAARKMLASTRTQDIHEIEVCPLDDALVLSLRKAEGEDFSPLSDLSYGEKCTAVFSIALIGRDKPLLVDQPEDELDHAFIINNIVEHIADVKDRRQLLISTHNPNIPVLGDAELVLKVGKVPGVERCTVETSGAFETPAIINRLQDLEGGPEAFQRRREKYGL